MESYRLHSWFYDSLLLISLFLWAGVFIAKPLELYYSYVPVVILLPFLILKYGLPKPLILIFLVLLISGLYKVSNSLNTYGQLFKVFFGAFFSYLFYYLILRAYKINVSYLFKLYLKAAWIITIIGIVQFFSYLIGFTLGYDYSWVFSKWSVIPGGNFNIRINAIFSEPTYYATFISPAIFVAVNNIIRKGFYYSKAQSAIMIVTYFLTFSGNAYNGFFIIILVMLFNLGVLRYSLLFIPLLLAGYFYSYQNIAELRDRLDGTLNIFETGQFEIGKTHGSAINLYDNYNIATQNFVNNPFFGTGLGSHPVAFEKYTITKHVNIYGFALNTQDANSMFLRLISETGLFGTSIFIFFLFYCFVKKRNEIDDEVWLISGSLFVLIILNLFRQGHFFYSGFPFYFWLYYFNWKNNNQGKLANGLNP